MYEKWYDLFYRTAINRNVSWEQIDAPKDLNPIQLELITSGINCNFMREQSSDFEGQIMTLRSLYYNLDPIFGFRHAGIVRKTHLIWSKVPILTSKSEFPIRGMETDPWIRASHSKCGKRHQKLNSLLSHLFLAGRIAHRRSVPYPIDSMKPIKSHQKITSPCW